MGGVSVLASHQKAQQQRASIEMHTATNSGSGLNQGSFVGYVLEKRLLKDKKKERKEGEAHKKGNRIIRKKDSRSMYMCFTPNL